MKLFRSPAPRSHAPRLGALALAGLVAAPLGVAQEPDARPRRPGAPTAPEDLPSPAFVRVAAGPEAKIANDLDQVLGHVHDHVIERATGRVTHVVIQTPSRDGGVHRFAVPFERFAWNPRERRLVLPLGPERLQSMPELDAERLGLVSRAAAAASGSADGAAREAAAERAPNVLGSDLDAVRVSAADGAPFGSVTGLVLEPRHGLVAFALVAAATREGTSTSDPYVVPWPALRPAEAPERGLRVDKTAAELADAPRLAGELGVSSLQRPRALETIRRFYGIRAPAAREAIGREG